MGVVAATISLTYEFQSASDAILFVKQGTALEIMMTLRRDNIVHIVTTSDDIQLVNHIAKTFGGMAIG